MIKVRAESTEAVYRAERTPAANIPFGARSVGRYRVPRGYRELREPRNFIQFYWGVEGRGIFTAAGKEFVMRAGDIFIYMPMEAHIFRAADDVWEYRWLTMDGDGGPRALRDFGFGGGVFPAAPCPSELFLKLKSLIQRPGPFAQRMACAAVFEILAAAGGGAADKSPESHAAGCAGIIADEYSDPDLSVAGLAERLGVSRFSLCAAFKEEFGIGPAEYIASVRIQKALSLLKETDLRVAEIADATGFRDPNYLTKRIKTATGQSPLKFRSRQD